MNSYLERARQAIESTTQDMTPDQFIRHPEGKWCAAEILEHLSRAFGTTVTLLQRCLDSGKSIATTPTWKQRLAIAVVVEAGYFPTGRPAPEYTRPKGLPPEAALSQVVENLLAMDKILTQCEQRFATGVKIANHPILGPLTVTQWRKFHLFHTRHHMKQIARLRNLNA